MKDIYVLYYDGSPNSIAIQNLRERWKNEFEEDYGKLIILPSGYKLEKLNGPVNRQLRLKYDQ